MIMTSDSIGNIVERLKLTLAACSGIVLDVDPPAIRAILGLQLLNRCSAVDRNHGEFHANPIYRTVEATPVLIVFVVSAPRITGAAMADPAIDMAGICSLRRRARTSANQEQASNDGDLDPVKTHCIVMLQRLGSQDICCRLTSQRRPSPSCLANRSHPTAPSAPC